MDISNLNVSITADASGLTNELLNVTKLLGQSAGTMQSSFSDLLVPKELGKKLGLATKEALKASAPAMSDAILKHLNDSLDETKKKMSALVNEQGKVTNPQKFEALLGKYHTLQDEIKKAEKAANKLATAEKNGQEIGKALTSSLEDGLATMGQSVGKAATGQKNPFAPMYQMLQKAAQDLGKKLISLGVPMLAIPGLQGQGLLYEAGGLALEVAAGAMTAIKMASGGIVSGSSFVNVGEYAGASHNPEVIAPLDKLRNMMGGGQMNHTFEIQGDKLVSILQRVDNNNSFALGGQ